MGVPRKEKEGEGGKNEVRDESKRCMDRVKNERMKVWNSDGWRGGSKTGGER